MNNNPIIIVEDDADDCELIITAIRDSGIQHSIKCFESGDTALVYLKSTDDIPLLIVSDVNMPRMTGLQFKELINENRLFKDKNIPFVFLSTTADQNTVVKAHALNSQGYFQKPVNFSEYEKIVKTIVLYCSRNKFKESVA